jgi:hypothetical protein
MARMLSLVHALALAIAPAVHAQTLVGRAAATITSMAPVITDTAAFEGYSSLINYSSCESPHRTKFRGD